MVPWKRRGIDYFPILRFKPGERCGLQYLPRQDKQKLFPLIPLGIVPNAKSFSKTLDRIDEMRGDSGMGVLIDTAMPEPFDADNKAHIELAALTSADNSFKAWRDFISGNDYMIPVLQTPTGIADRALYSQISGFQELGRGMVLRLKRGRADVVDLITKIIPRFSDLTALLFYIDLGKIGHDFHVPMAQAAALIERLLGLAEGRHIYVVCGGSSFPSSFVGTGQIEILPIYERLMFAQLLEMPSLKKPNLHLYYGDYGSARAEDASGWKAPPRLDYAASSRWIYSRHPDEEKQPGLRAAARAIIRDENWVEGLNIWGAEKIREASKNDISDIKASWAPPAIRINLHLHAQINYGDKEAFLNTDEEWQD